MAVWGEASEVTYQGYRRELAYSFLRASKEWHPCTKQDVKWLAHKPSMFGTEEQTADCHSRHPRSALCDC